LGEAGLLGDFDNAVERLASLYEELPTYVRASLDRRRASEILLADSGTPFNARTAATVDDFDEFMAEQDELAEHALNSNPEEFAGVGEETISLDGTRMYTNTSLAKRAFLSNFVDNLKESVKETHQSANSMSVTERDWSKLNPDQVIDIHNVEAERDSLASEIAELNEEQAAGFEVLRLHVSNPDSTQVIMFLSGEGGTGKSKLIHTITKYTRCLHGKTEGPYGAVLKTAPTGGASHNIHGHTWQSALGKTTLSRLTSRTELSDAQKTTLQKKLLGVKLFILDELSLASLEDFYEISKRMCIGTGVYDKPFGGVHTLLAGDFYQMKTMGGTPIVEPNVYRDKVEARIAKDIWTQKLTHFVVLVKNVRAQSANGQLSELARFVSSTRVGDAGPDILAIINTRIVNTTEKAMEDADKNAVWITSTHNKIDAINKKFFMQMVLCHINLVTTTIY
jgi:hypothetical protein